SIAAESGDISDVALELIDKASFTLSGNSVAATDFNGHVTIINFWASWCAPCQIEFPALLNLAEKHDDTITLILHSSDRNIEALQKFLRTQNSDQLLQNNVIVTWDQTGLIRKDYFDAYKIPETLIVNQYGQKKYRV